MSRSITILLSLLTVFICMDSYAQKRCAEVVKSEVVVEISGVDFVFSNTNQTPEALTSSLKSLLSLMSGEQSPINKLIENKKILELKKHFSGTVEELYETIRRVRGGTNKEPRKEQQPNRNQQALGRQNIVVEQAAGFQIEKGTNLTLGDSIIQLRSGKIATPDTALRPKLLEMGQALGLEIIFLEGARGVIEIIVELRDGRLITARHGGGEEGILIWGPKGNSYEITEKIKAPYENTPRSLVELADGRLALSDNHSMLHIFSAVGDSYKRVASINVRPHTMSHVGPIIELEDGRLLIVVARALEIWKPYDGVLSWFKKQSYVKDVEVGAYLANSKIVRLRDGRVVLADANGNLQVWEEYGDTYVLVANIEGSESKWLARDWFNIHFIVELSNKHLAVGSSNGMVVIFEPEGPSYRELGATWTVGATGASANAAIELQDGRLATGHFGKEIKFLNINYNKEEL